MKIFTHFSRYIFPALLCAFLLPVSSQARSDAVAEEKVLSVEEADALIESLPKSGDAVEGTVPTEVDQEFYNIYTRQIAYGENAKEFRASIEERRESYKGLSAPKKEEYDEVMRKVQRAQSAAYQKSLKSGEEEDIEIADFQMMDGQESEEGNKADKEISDGSVTDSQSTTSGGLEELPLPPNADEYGKVKKKVVTSDDAPEFDPANLPSGGTMPVGEVPGEPDDLNDHMPEAGNQEVEAQEAKESPVELKMVPGSVIDDPLDEQ